MARHNVWTNNNTTVKLLGKRTLNFALLLQFVYYYKNHKEITDAKMEYEIIASWYAQLLGITRAMTSILIKKAVDCKFITLVGNTSNHTGKLVGHSTKSALYANTYFITDKQWALIEDFLDTYFGCYPELDKYHWLNPYKSKTYNALSARVSQFKKPANLSCDDVKIKHVRQHEIALHARFDEKLTALNKLYPEYEMKYLSYGKGRGVNGLESTPKDGYIRKIKLSNLFGCRFEDIEEYDVNGSIYRLSYNLNHDEPLAHDVDVYGLLYDAIMTNLNIDGPAFLSSESRRRGIRSTIKQLAMPVYMNGSSYGHMYNLMHDYCHKMHIYTAANFNWLDYADLSCIQAHFFWTGFKGGPRPNTADILKVCDARDIFINGLQIEQIQVDHSIGKRLGLVAGLLDFWNIEVTPENIRFFLKTAYYTMKQIFGRYMLRKYVFLYETDLHILMREKCMQMNIHTLNVYDGFYFDKNTFTKNDFFELYDNCIVELKQAIDTYNAPLIARRLKALKNNFLNAKTAILKYKGIMVQYIVDLDIFVNSKTGEVLAPEFVLLSGNAEKMLDYL